MNELESLKKKIKYRSAYRGTKEMDLLLTSFVSSIINILSYGELEKLDNFLNCNDEDISNLYLNKIPITSFTETKILTSNGSAVTPGTAGNGYRLTRTWTTAKLDAWEAGSPTEVTDHGPGWTMEFTGGR